MAHTVLDPKLQYFCQATAKELYYFARHLTGNDEDAWQISSDALVKAYGRSSKDSNLIDFEQLKLLSIRLLYQYGRSTKSKQNNASAHKGQELLANKSTALFSKLEKLSYSQRFVALLFCSQKLQVEHISQILRLPQFIVTRWLLSAAKKTVLLDQMNLANLESTGRTPNLVHPVS